jgi:hypothetical protein
MPIAEKANSVMLFLATMTAPAALSLRRIGASSVAGGKPALIFEPARVGSPLTSNRSLIVTMRPSSAPSSRPKRLRPSAASAAPRASCA